MLRLHLRLSFSEAILTLIIYFYKGCTSPKGCYIITSEKCNLCRGYENVNLSFGEAQH
jgi:hypothetical protein